MTESRSRGFLLLQVLKAGLAGIVIVLSAQMLMSKPAPHIRKSIVSNWSNRYVLYKESSDDSKDADFEKDPRREQNWYLRHPEAWWPENRRVPKHRLPEDPVQRDWSLALGASTSSTVINFSFVINTTETAYGTVNVTDQGGGNWLATSGTLTITGGADVGTWSLIAGGPGVTLSPLGRFDYDNLITPSANPALDAEGLLFGTTTEEINVWGNSANNYSFYDATSAGYGTTIVATGSFSFQPAPGGGQSTPAKYSFDVTATPSCANDFVAVGIAAKPASGGQANIVGANNLYSTSPASSAPNCTTNGPTVKFAYASGTGEVPASLAISQNGTQLAYVENLSTGKSYFHVLTIGTTGSNGTSPTAAVVPGTGNNAVDNTVLLSPDGGVTNQSSTGAPFISYTDGDVADTAYLTTYSNAGNSGYLYKIGNVFSSSAPTILWKVDVTAIPGPPTYDTAANAVFFTDSNGRIDYVVDSGTSPTVTYGPIVAAGTTSLNPVTVDNVGKMVYATFNTNGTNAIVVQAPISLASTVSVAVGTGNTTYSGPYGVEFNNAWYTGGTGPLLYVVGTGSGTTPTLYDVGFGSGGLLNGTTANNIALVSAAGADASPPTEFYNTTLSEDFLFVGVTNNCVATRGGGTAGCVMSLNITTGFPTVNTRTTALAASGGTTEIVVDNYNTSLSQASSIYYGTKTGSTLVKATQSALQ